MLHVVFHNNSKTRLDGRHVFVSSPDEARGRMLANALEQRGARVWHLPTIIFDMRADLVAECFEKKEHYDWVALLSPRAARVWISAKPPPHVKIAAVGPQTAKVLQTQARKVELIPRIHDAEHLALELASRLEQLPETTRVLLPQSNIGRDTFGKTLQQHSPSTIVDRCTAYETHGPTAETANRIRSLFDIENVDAAVFTSPSTFANFSTIVSADRLRTLGTRLFSIGETTAQALRTAGLHCILPRKADYEGLVDAVCEAFEKR